MIPRLHARYGAFADLDGDGDLDYVATEMTHDPERIAIHLRIKDGWRRVAEAGREFQAKHPLRPWVIGDDGTGNPAVLVPTGWPPHFYLYRTDGRGRFRGKPLTFAEQLPKRISRAMGVDNNPYGVTRVVSAKGGLPARIEGIMEDKDENGRKASATFVVELHGQRVIGKSKAIPDQQDQIDWSRFPAHVTPVRRECGCNNEEHQGPERRAIMATKPLDLNGDGITDVVHFTGDFAAHVFLGRRDPKSGKVVFGEEQAGPFGIPRLRSYQWFWDFMRTTGSPSGYAVNAVEVFDKIGFRILLPEQGDARVVMLSEKRHGFVVNYYWTGSQLVPVFWNRSLFPRRNGDDFGWTSRRRKTLLVDCDGDGSLDLLSRIPGHEFRWLRRPKPGQVFLTSGDYRDLGDFRYMVTYWPGESNYAATRSLLAAQRETGVPKDRHMGLPVELESVPVFVGDTISGHRYCLYDRSCRVGTFLAVRPAQQSPAGNRPLRERAWRRRGERLLELDSAFYHCDQQITEDPLKFCTPSGKRSSARHAAARFFFRTALTFADTRPQRASLHHLLARCASRMQDQDAAMAAYDRYVALGRRIDPLDRFHSDLAWLFSRDWFRRYHERASSALARSR
ncbi:MAG: hypothetical protein H6836_08365 [Planctomycetes bacterium]|nr:hypothetical protein [Planctomycetota bacterium]